MVPHPLPLWSPMFSNALFATLNTGRASKQRSAREDAVHPHVTTCYTCGQELLE